MGGRKKTGKKEKKLRTYAIPKMFDCERCSADQTLNIQIKKDKNKKFAKIFCVKCKHKDEKVPVAPLDSAIDVYNKWCERQSGGGQKDYDDYDDDDDLNGVIDEDADVNEDDIPDQEF